MVQYKLNLVFVNDRVQTAKAVLLGRISVWAPQAVLKATARISDFAFRLV
jgi:hypothetical protein